VKEAIETNHSFRHSGTIETIRESPACRAFSLPHSIGASLVMRFGNQLEHLDVDDKKSVNLPKQARPHEAGESRWCRRIVSLLVRLSVGDVAHIQFLVNL